MTPNLPGVLAVDELNGKKKKKISFRLAKSWGSTEEGMPAVTKQDATDRASPAKVLPHPLT